MVKKHRLLDWAVALLLAGTAGCAPAMYQQPRNNPLSSSDFFPDGRSERPVVPGTVPHRGTDVKPSYETGKQNGQVVERMPIPLTRDLLERGQERFDIYCSPCHGRMGDGDGMIVKRGFQSPPSYHIPRLRTAPDGHFFEVITNGFGAMSSYENRIPVHDRWAITSYIRALQLSQDATIEDVPADKRQLLEAMK